MLKRIFSMLAVIGLLLVPIREAAAQDGNLKGLVQDETGAPIAGAFVTVKGETRGVMTDEDGHFQLSVKPTDVLIFSFLGYNDEEITVGNQKDILVKMVPQANQLDEVVMVAYGAQKKASVIGSISSVDVAQLQVPVGQLSTGLAGKLAGVVAVQHSGEPGSSAEF